MYNIHIYYLCTHVIYRYMFYIHNTYIYIYKQSESSECSSINISQTSNYMGKVEDDSFRKS